MPFTADSSKKPTNPHSEHAVQDLSFKPLVIKKVDNLAEMPEAVKSDHKIIALGDLHGSAMKLLHFLIQQGVIETDRENYNEFYKLYMADNDENTVKRTKFLVNKFVVNKECPFLRFLGDDLADRGANDFITLLIFKKLADNGVKFDINISNHTVEFYTGYDCFTKREETLPFEECNFFSCNQVDSSRDPIWRSQVGMDEQTTRSMYNLQALIMYKFLEEPELNELVSMHQQHSTILSYALSDDGIRLYTHAPVDLAIIQDLTRKWNLPYRDETPLELAATIDLINQTYRTILLKDGFSKMIDMNALSLYSNSGRADVQKLLTREIAQQYPLERIVWNRDYNMDRSAKHPKGYQVGFVHGHDSNTAYYNRPEAAHITNLDSNFGKFDQGINNTFPFHLCGQYSFALVENPILYDRGIPELNPVLRMKLRLQEIQAASTDNQSNVSSNKN